MNVKDHAKLLTTETDKGEALHERRLSLPSPSACIALLILAFWIAVAIFGPLFAPYGEGVFISDDSFAPSSSTALLGTDYLGRDLLSRVIYGARMTLGLALVATALSFSTGITLGFIAAIIGGWVDTVLSRLVDAIMAFPSIMLALIIIGGVGTSLPVVILSVALVDSTRVFRLSRALAMDISVMDYVDVARARGEGVIYILYREVLPNAVIPLTAEFGLRYTFAILFISSLSFLGLGVQPPVADWGVMVKENMQGLFYGSPASLIPALCIATVTIAVNLLIDWFLHQRSDQISEEMLQ